MNEVVRITFMEFETQAGADFVEVYQGWDGKEFESVRG